MQKGQHKMRGMNFLLPWLHLLVFTILLSSSDETSQSPTKIPCPRGRFWGSYHYWLGGGWAPFWTKCQNTINQEIQVSVNLTGNIFHFFMLILSHTILNHCCLSSRNSIERSSKNVESYDTDDEDNELEEKMVRLLEMFPQLTRTELLEVSR